jgi:DnaJ-class molecular chaperone
MPQKQGEDQIQKQKVRVSRKYIECPDCDGCGEVGDFMEKHPSKQFEFRTCSRCFGRGQIKLDEL